MSVETQPTTTMTKLSLTQIDLKGKRVLVRVDFNVPLEERDGKQVVTDDTRIRETLPTINYLREHGAKVMLMSHLGRPKGKPVEKYSLRPVAARLEELIGQPVAFASDCVGKPAEEIGANLRDGGVALLENVRFHTEEEKNDAAFARALAKLGDVYVNDAFGSAHRAHASTEGVARLMPVAVAGFLMQKELRYLAQELEKPARPFVVVLGGAKVSDKITVIDRLLEKADTILIGGAMAYTFELAKGRSAGKSLTELDKVETARLALNKAEKLGVKFLLPIDSYIVEQIDFEKRTVSSGKFTLPDEPIPEGWMGVDIGPETIELFSTEIAKARTIFWNGPMGVFEIKDCAKGTFAIAEAIAANSNAVSIIGGGDSVKAVKKAHVADQITFISTGGGASLELLEGKELPGVTALSDASARAAA
jgi:phosphoglycerate kinase